MDASCNPSNQLVQSQSLGYGSVAHHGLPPNSQSLSSASSERTIASQRAASEADMERQESGHSNEIHRAPSTSRNPFNAARMHAYYQEYLKGDIVAALTVASLYIPLSFSFANLAHVSPSSSLYAFVFHPLVWALLGSAPLMVVGPEATGSLLVGAAIRYSKAKNQEDETFAVGNLDSLLSGAVTALAGSILLGAGLMRLGFLDNVVNRPFMHGFISGIGFVLIVEQTLVGFGITGLVKDAGFAEGSAITKLIFMFWHLRKVHSFSAAITVSSLIFNLLISAWKKRNGKRNTRLLLFPDRLFVIAATAIVTYAFSLNNRGLAIVGPVDSSQLGFPSPRLPLRFTDTARLQNIASTSMLVALLGFFESSVAAKSLRSPDPSTRTRPNANRDLVALGVANVVGGCFSTLPAFGGFGRSKLNVQAGGLTRMSSVFLAIASLICALYATPLLYYVPISTLAAMSIAVGISMVEEAYADLVSISTCQAWRELALMFLVFLSIIFHSMGLGIVLGLTFSIISLIHDSTKSHTVMSWTSLDLPNSFPFGSPYPGIESYLHVKVGTSLTYISIGPFISLLESRICQGRNSRLIIDVQNTAVMDFCAAQVLKETVERLAKEGSMVFLCRPTSPDVDRIFMNCGILSHVMHQSYMENLVVAEEVLKGLS